jgi:GDP-mannose 6-dehydrogenase
VRVYDRDVMLSEVFGRNREYIDRSVPHISSLLCGTLDDLVDSSDVVVVGKRFDDLDAVLRARPRQDQTVLDLVRMWSASTPEIHGRPISRVC